MSTLDWVHLVGLDEGLADAQRRQTYPALCGEPVAESDLSPTLCSEGGKCELVYCLECLRAANECNWDAGVDGDCPPGIVGRMAR